MSLRLPRWESLSQDEQIPIINLPLSRTYIVTGGPGTGKTVMAIHRAAKWRAAQEDGSTATIKFLVFNKPLMKYLKQALSEAELTEANAQTWHSWFYKYYHNNFRQYVPQVSDYKPDWELVTPQLTPIFEKSGPIFDHLVLDEAQDLPKELLCLLKLACKNATVFADERQSLNPEASTIADITNAFAAQSARYFLNRNYRNTQEISDLAQLFYTGDPTDLPARPIRTGEKPHLVKVISFEGAVRLIATYGDNNPEQNTGVLLPDNSLRQRYFDAINGATETAKVQQYQFSSKNSDDFDFDADGIKLLSYNTAKGLEFDAVFMPEIDNQFFSVESIEKLNKTYVCMTRAKDKLYLLHSNPNADSFVLKRISNSVQLVTPEEY